MKQKSWIKKLNSMPRTYSWCNSISTSKKRGKFVSCNMCKKEIWRRPSAIKEINYCSYKCLGLNKKNKNLSIEHRSKISTSGQGINKPTSGVRGKKHWNYRHGLSKTKEYIAFKTRIRDYKKRSNGGQHTLKEWTKLKMVYNFTCPACLKREPEISLTEDHIVPLHLGGSNKIANIQPLCRSCNSRKGINITNYSYVA